MVLCTYKQEDRELQFNRADTFLRVANKHHQEVSVHFFGEGFMQNAIHATLNKIRGFFKDGELTEEEKLAFFQFLEKENPTYAVGWGFSQRVTLTDTTH